MMKLNERFEGYVKRINPDVRAKYCDENLFSWENAKSKVLVPKLFGERLTIEKEINVKQSIDEVISANSDLFKEIDDDLYELRMKIRDMSDLVGTYCAYWCSDCPLYETNKCLKSKGNCLGNSHRFLYDNILYHSRNICANKFDLRTIDADNFYYEMDGKATKIDARKDKPIRIARKLLSKYFPSLVEEFDAICQKASRLTQKTKTMEGTLILSIDPLDFLTTSDNNYGWTSCQSLYSGNYSCGVLSTMNSKHTFMVYFVDKDRPLYNEEYGVRDKKWRALVCMNENGSILLNKQYPYNYDELANKTIKFIEELTGKDLKESKYDMDDFNIETGCMYADCYCSNSYTRVFSVENNEIGNFQLGSQNYVLLVDGSYNVDEETTIWGEYYDDEEEYYD